MLRWAISALFLIDLFGRPVTINFSGKEKFKSSFGGACSLIFFGFLAWVFYNGSKDMFKRENPNIISSETFLNDPREMTLTSDTFPISIGIQGPASMDFMPYINESIYTVDFVYITMTRVIHPDGSTEEIFSDLVLEKEICTPSHFGELAEVFAKTAIDKTYCLKKKQPDLEKVSIQGVYASTYYTYLLVKVIECNNETSPVPCASEEVREEHLSGGWFNVLYVNMAVDPNNFTRPDAKYQDIYSTMISPINYKETIFQLSHVDVTTDAGWIMPDIYVKNSSKVNKLNEYLQFKPHPDKVLMACSFEVSRIENHCSRVYKTIQDVLAEVGGLANVGLVVIFILTTPYLNLKFRESLINELFDINLTHTKNSKESKKKRNKKLNKESAQQSFKAKKQVANQSKAQHEVQMTKTDNIRIDVPKANRTYDSCLFPQTQPILPPSSEENRLNLNGESNKESSSPFYSPLITDFSPPDKRQEKEFTHHQKKLRNGYQAKSVCVKKNLWNDLGVNTRIQNINNKRHSQKSLEPHLENSKKYRKNSKALSPACQQKVIKLYQKVVEDDSPDQPSLASEAIIPDCYLDDDKQREQMDSSRNAYEEEFKREGTSIILVSDKNTKGLKCEDEEKLEDIASVSTHTPQKINLTVWEYICSFFHQSDALKEKMNILSEGMKNIDARLDVFNLLKKLREIDKLKALLLEQHQLVLFNNLPKPEINMKVFENNTQRVSFSHVLLKKPTFIEQGETASQVFDAHTKIEEKEKKTKIDQRLVSIFREKHSMVSSEVNQESNQ